jgi:hypothetical protein
MFIYLDTETTGTGPADRLCQISFKTEEDAAVDELFNPGLPISIDAMTVHHITNEMVRDKPPFRNSDAWRKLQDLVNSDGNIMVAHTGLNFSNYLSESSMAKLAELIKHLSKSNTVVAPVWVPEILTAVSAEGTSFPAEVTLSSTDSGEAASFILILRNINDRLAAEE